MDAADKGTHVCVREHVWKHAAWKLWPVARARMRTAAVTTAVTPCLLYRM